jgi:hypothetical protein
MLDVDYIIGCKKYQYIHGEKNFQRSSASSPGANPVDSARFGPRIEGGRGNDP